MCIAEKKRIREKMSREWKVLMKKSAGVIEKCLRRIFIYANQSLRLCETLATAAITRENPRSVFSLVSFAERRLSQVIVHGAGMCTGTEVRNDLILEIYGHVPFFIIFDCVLIKSQCVDRIEVCLDG